MISFDPDGTAVDDDGRILRSFAGLYVKSPSVPRTFDDVAIQMPYVLTGGIGAVVLAALGVGVLRSQDDKAILDRLADVEGTNLEVKERVDYLTHLLETGLLPDDSLDVTTNNAQAPARVR